MSEFEKKVVQLRDRTSGLLPPPPNPPYDGGEPPGFEMLEKRVENLEKDMREVKSDLTDIKVTLATISAKLDSKVDYKWLTIYVLGIVAVVLRHEIMAFLTSFPTP
ncbi:hypothetical protein [Salipiger abyssi]|uniref:hypothetical protein n=1 Tax=Salipiger abyssi TaxID=1250539 RepID=UPI0012EBD314|nr:hypothetical protein [Salipiger abyssi]